MIFKNRFWAMLGVCLACVNVAGCSQAPSAASSLEEVASVQVQQKLLAGVYETPAPGIIMAGGRKLQLADIIPVALTETCERSGKAYPCGFYGQQAWSAALQGEDVSFVIKDKTQSVDFVKSSTASIEDLGLWFIQSGFAKATADAPQTYHFAEAEARQRRSGIHNTRTEANSPK